MSLTVDLKHALRSFSNIHRQGEQRNIMLFATARGGSTWVMELLASQPGVKFYDEPFNIRRENVARTGLFPDWASVMPDTNDVERIVTYLKDLERGKYGPLNPPPFRPYHRFFTNRIVFKIHELEHMIGTIAARCNAQVLYLLRHPIPTTLSRKVFPRLDLFLESAYYRELIGDGPRLREIVRLGRNGSHLQRGTVSWCYENLIPLRHADFDGLFATYEELSLNPVGSCDLLLQWMGGTDREAMLRAFGEPSANITMSSAETQSMMNDADERRRRTYLVTKWLDKVTPAQMAEVSEILHLFELDAFYTGQDPLPHQHVHLPSTRERLQEAQARA